MPDQSPDELTIDEMRAYIAHQAKQPTGKSNIDFSKFTPAEMAMVQKLNQERAEANKGKDLSADRKDSAMVGGIPLINNLNPEDLLMGGQLFGIPGMKTGSISGAVGRGIHGGADALASGKGWGAGLGGFLKGLMGEGPSAVGPAVVGGGAATEAAPILGGSDLNTLGAESGPRAPMVTRPSLQPPTSPKLTLDPSTIEKMRAGGEGGVANPTLSDESVAKIRSGRPLSSAPSPMHDPAFEQSEKDTTDLMNAGMEEGDFKQQLKDSLKIRRRGKKE